MKQYEKYKDSGVEWIGEIPSDWNLKKLKYCLNYTTGFTPPTGKEEFYNGEHTWVTIADMKQKIVKESSTQLSDEAIEQFKPDITPKDSLLYSFKLSVGKVAFAGKDLYTNEAIMSILPTPRNNLRFLYFSLPEQLLFNANENIYGAKLLNQELIRNASLLIPPTPEQTAIAAYLDEKTARIDKLIANKQRLIELLKEERTAIINHAVTKGINPKAKLKPSGIEWLGDIPEHWEVKKLKYVAAIKYGLGQPPTQKDDGLPLIRATNVERGKIVDKDLIFVDPDDVPYDRDPVLKENDIIVVRSGAYTADSAIIPKKYEGAITGYDMVVRVNNDNAIFISYCLLSQYVLINQLYLQRLRAAQPHLNKEELGETFLLLPTIQEQQRIVQYIETSTQKIDATIAKIEKEIELMQEYRTALISEVVTGKIKVI